MLAIDCSFMHLLSIDVAVWQPFLPLYSLWYSVLLLACQPVGAQYHQCYSRFVIGQHCLSVHPVCGCYFDWTNMFAIFHWSVSACRKPNASVSWQCIVGSYSPLVICMRLTRRPLSVLAHASASCWLVSQCCSLSTSSCLSLHGYHCLVLPAYYVVLLQSCYLLQSFCVQSSGTKILLSSVTALPLQAHYYAWLCG